MHRSQDAAFESREILRIRCLILDLLRAMMPFLSRFGTPVFKNTGSVARDHLASERTFLAWLRTGLGLIALGVAVERFSKLEPVVRSLLHAAEPTASRTTSLPASRPTREYLLVGSLVGIGSSSIVYGSVRYFSNVRMLEKGLFRPSYFGAASLGLAVAGPGRCRSLGRPRRRRIKSGGERSDISIL